MASSTSISTSLLPTLPPCATRSVRSCVPFEPLYVPPMVAVGAEPVFQPVVSGVAELCVPPASQATSSVKASPAPTVPAPRVSVSPPPSAISSPGV